MIRLVSDLLDRIPGDAVLHFQYEQIWLLRRNDELSLNERSDIWPPQRLALGTPTFPARYLRLRLGRVSKFDRVIGDDR
jgi:hypothetical protein